MEQIEFLDQKLIDLYCHNFMGYGNIKSDTLVIGLEEGDKKKYHTFDRISARINAVTDQLIKNKGLTIDFLESHKIHSPEHYNKIINNKLFSQYWRVATRVIMKSKKIDVNNNEDIAFFFKEEVIKNMCILEFRPLACTDLGTWNYNKWTNNIEYLETRKKYQEWIDPIRIKNMRSILNNNNFKNVLIFGKSLEKQWGDIIGIDFAKAKIFYYNKISIKILNHNNINYILIPQASCRGTSNLFYDWVGSQINEINTKK